MSNSTFRVQRKVIIITIRLFNSKLNCGSQYYIMSYWCQILWFCILICGNISMLHTTLTNYCTIIRRRHGLWSHSPCFKIIFFFFQQLPPMPMHQFLFYFFPNLSEGSPLSQGVAGSAGAVEGLMRKNGIWIVEILQRLYPPSLYHKTFSCGLRDTIIQKSFLALRRLNNQSIIFLCSRLYSRMYKTSILS